jgi:hypothetical protein
VGTQSVQPVCLLLRPPNQFPDIAGIPRAPPSVLTEGLATESNPPGISDGANTLKISFHLSKIRLFVKEKMESGHFFSKTLFVASREGRSGDSVSIFSLRNILLFQLKAREN